MISTPILKPDELASFRLRELYRSYGYSHYRMSKFEEYDLYVRNKSFLVSDRILTFTDTDGRLMALKPDVTLSIVKNSRDDSDALQKVYYHEHVYRTSSSSVGYREILQTGLECIGQLDLYAVGEVIALAAKSLQLIHDDYLLDLSHMGFVSGLLSPLEDNVRSALLEEIGRKNTPAIADLCAQAGISGELTDRICRLTQLYGSADQVLPALQELAEGEQMTAALEELTRLCALLKNAGLSDNLRLDFSIVNDMSYYNGVIFRGYLPGLAEGVLAGGRYDPLMARMGKRCGAIGFAVYLDQLDRLYETAAGYDVDTLLLFSDADDPAAVAAAMEQLTKNGQTVRAERSIPKDLRYQRLIRMEGGSI